MSFDDFWIIYPRKESKGAARKSHEKAVKNVSHETIMSGLSKYIERIDSKKVERKFIKMPATWLNQECWDDEFTPTLRQQLSEIPSGENEFQQTTREYYARIEKANQWWKDNGHAPGLLREYAHRCKHGLPTQDDLVRFKAENHAVANRPEPGFKTIQPVKPHYVHRDVVRTPDMGDTTPPDAREAADSGVQPPEPPPVMDENEYGAGVR